MDRTLEMGLLPFPILAHVEEDEVLARLHHLAHQLGRNLEFEKMVAHGRISAPRRPGGAGARA